MVKMLINMHAPSLHACSTSQNWVTKALEAHHALTCKRGSDVIARHNHLCDTLHQLFKKALYNPKLEVGSGLAMMQCTWAGDVSEGVNDANTLPTHIDWQQQEILQILVWNLDSMELHYFTALLKVKGWSHETTGEG